MAVNLNTNVFLPNVKLEKREQAIFYLLNIALLLFGTAFSKFNVVGPLFLHDVILGLLTLYSLNRIPRKIRFGSIIIVFVLACLYLLYSLLFFDLSSEFKVIAIRQFAIFLYLFCCYYIVVYKTDTNDNIAFLIWISRLSIIIQLIYYAYGFLFVPGFSLFGTSNYPYYSPLGIMGIITYAGYTLAYPVKYKSIKFIGVLLISTMLGHSSVFLAVFLMGFTYLLLWINMFQRGIFISFGMLIIFLLTFLPQFNDANASWRMLYWHHIFEQTVNLDTYGLVGNGFGKPYMSYEYAKYIESIIGPTDLAKDSKYLLRWLTPPHNSFLTFIYHIGVFPMLIFGLVVLYRPIIALFNLSINHDTRDYLFVLISFVGLSTWASFNVILELPHSAIYYWLVFFTLIAYKKKNEKRVVLSKK